MPHQQRNNEGGVYSIFEQFLSHWADYVSSSFVFTSPALWLAVIIMSNNMRHIVTAIFLFVTSFVFGQTATYKWDDETCSYESVYDTKLYSEILINNCFLLVKRNEFRINYTPMVFKPSDIQKINIDTLDCEYKNKHKALKKISLPKTKFWKEYRKRQLIEQKQLYKLSRIAYQSYIDTKFLKQFKSKDSCAIKHSTALILGGDILLNNWYHLRLEMASRNCCPEKVMSDYNRQLLSDDKFQYAKVDVLTFGWWNCANNSIEYTNNYFDYETIDKEIYALFLNTKTMNCDEP